MNFLVRFWISMSPRVSDAIGLVVISVAANMLFSLDDMRLPIWAGLAVALFTGLGGITLSLASQAVIEMTGYIREEARNKLSREEFNSKMIEKLSKTEWAAIGQLTLVTIHSWLFGIAVLIGYYVFRS